MPEKSIIQTKKQRRAQTAYPLVEAVPADSREKYGKLAKKFPALVHTCGLAEATAFVKAQEGEVGTIYLSSLMSVMDFYAEYGLQAQLHEECIKAELPEYQRFTRNAIESSTWLKRYSEALFR